MNTGRWNFGQSALLGMFSLVALVASQLYADGQVSAEKKPAEKRVTVTTVGKAPAKKTTKRRVKLDLNTAPVRQLMTLPGVDVELARKISAGRPYDSVQDLARVGVPAATIDEIAPLVRIRPVDNRLNRINPPSVPPPQRQAAPQPPPPPPPPPAGSHRPPSD